MHYSLSILNALGESITKLMIIYLDVISWFVWQFLYGCWSCTFHIDCGTSLPSTLWIATCQTCTSYANATASQLHQLLPCALPLHTHDMVKHMTISPKSLCKDPKHPNHLLHKTWDHCRKKMSSSKRYVGWHCPHLLLLKNELPDPRINLSWVLNKEIPLRTPRR